MLFSEILKNIVLESKNNDNLKILDFNILEEINPPNKKYSKIDEIKELISDCEEDNRKCLDLIKNKEFYDSDNIDPYVALYIIKKLEIPLIRINSPVGKIFKVQSYEILKNKEEFTNEFKLNKIYNGKPLGKLLKNCIDQVNKYPILLNKEYYENARIKERKLLNEYNENSKNKSIKPKLITFELKGGANFQPALTNFEEKVFTNDFGILDLLQKFKTNLETKEIKFGTIEENSFAEIFKQYENYLYQKKKMYILAKYLNRYFIMKEEKVKENNDDKNIINYVNRNYDFKKNKNNKNIIKINLDKN